MVYPLFGVMWVMLGRMKECLESWRGQRGNRTVLQIWRMAPLCVMWCLWIERNAWSFEDRELGLTELKKRLLHSSQVSMLVEFLYLCASF